MNTFIIRHLLVVALVLFATSAQAGQESQKHPRILYKLWEAIKHPFRGPPEALGAYSAGCLVGAKPLAEKGVGYQLMRPARVRNFGHPELLEVIRSAGKSLRKVNGADLLIGDLSRPRGGPTISGHVSHQTGLDVDVWYLQSKRKLSKKKRNEMNAQDFVAGEKLKGWKKSYSRAVRAFASDSRVERIFVHAAIKRHLCSEYGANAPWIAKLRPWWGHSDHFHVRLRCPAGNGRCEGQEPVDPGHAGCGDELAWWFSQEAKDELAKRQSEIQSEDRPFPELPKDCEKLTVSASGAK